MARSGIYKSEVIRARNALLAQGRYPSIDAVRIELGNTGSKATIHRYLKEIEEETGGHTGNKVAVSDAIQDLVGRLAAQLHEDADRRAAEQAAHHRSDTEALQGSLNTLRAEAEALRKQLAGVEVRLSDERAAHRATQEKLQAGDVDRAKLGEQVHGLALQLAQAQEHRVSLEDKHRQAREALEHFRQAAREQRKREAQQHEGQVAHLQTEMRKLQDSLTAKLSELTIVNREAARLGSELVHANKALREKEAEIGQLRERMVPLQDAERRFEEVGWRLAEREQQIRDLQERNALLERDDEMLREQTQAMTVELATARAMAQAHEASIADLRAQIALLSMMQPQDPQSSGGISRQRGRAKIDRLPGIEKADREQ
jgi:chromosome segregation ATPase